MVTDPETERGIALEQRAHELRLMMYRTPGLLGRLDDGYAAAERGEVVTLAEVDRRLAEAE